ncbi:hypothetical protein RHMOL_Rhmol07G0038900 [Rhododendron molle]|uniref:Uncharacterized protein n=1 Tax=Rhododendron molle TaxID=49168 RepID=A0ACC0MWY2_RHOML|nr:hypothetical protein RHMOL_Rhmol07G0038900 [Rhododendron molle]
MERERVIECSTSVPSSASAFATSSSASATTTKTSTSLTVSSPSGTTSTVSTTISPATKLPFEINGKTVEVIINECNSELLEHTGKFQKQANAIAEWDKRILQNGDILVRLETEVAKVVETQANLEWQLELIETHQQEVDKGLQSVEEEAERIYKHEHNLLLNNEAVSARDAMYEQANILERGLEQMSEHIETIIQTLRAGNLGGELEREGFVNPVDHLARAESQECVEIKEEEHLDQADFARIGIDLSWLLPRIKDVSAAHKRIASRLKIEQVAKALLEARGRVQELEKEHAFTHSRGPQHS